MPAPIDAPAGPLHSQIVPRLTGEPVAGPVGVAPPPPGGAGTPGLGALGEPWGADEPPPEGALPAADRVAGLLVPPWDLDLGAAAGAPDVPAFGVVAGDGAAPAPVAAGAV